MSLPDGNSPLHIAVINNRLDEIQRLVRLPETERDLLNHHGETPLFLSLQRGCSDHVVSELIDCGCNVNVANEGGLTPLHVAVKRSNPLILSKLMENGADTNAKDKGDNCTPLHEAIRARRLCNLKELLKMKETIFIDAKNYRGQTPLMFSMVITCSDEIIATLIDNGCDVTIPDNYGVTPLHYAVCRESTLIAQKLIENGADIDISSERGYSPLETCVLAYDVEFLCMLLYYGASVNETDYLGGTPFYNALISGSENIAEHLLNYVVDFNQHPYLSLALQMRLNIAGDLVDRCDVNHLHNGIHSLLAACMSNSPYEILQSIWSKTDFNIFIPSLGHHDFLGIFCELCDFPNDKFIKFLYTIFDSPHIDDLLSHRDISGEHQSVISLVFSNRETRKCSSLSPNQRLEILLVLLSQSVDVYFEDVRCLYELYGFDESVELLLMNGCYINPGGPDTCFDNPIVSQICSNNIDMSIDGWSDSRCYRIRLKEAFDEELIRNYNKFYRATFIVEDDCMLLMQPDISSLGEISSLQQLSRDLIRKLIYASSRTCYSFTVYQAISKLPVPSIIKDILFLKRPIYI